MRLWIWFQCGPFLSLLACQRNGLSGKWSRVGDRASVSGNVKSPFFYPSIRNPPVLTPLTYYRSCVFCASACSLNLSFPPKCEARAYNPDRKRFQRKQRLQWMSRDNLALWVRMLKLGFRSFERMLWSISDVCRKHRNRKMVCMPINSVIYSISGLWLSLGQILLNSCTLFLYFCYLLLLSSSLSPWFTFSFFVSYFTYITHLCK